MKPFLVAVAFACGTGAAAAAPFESPACRQAALAALDDAEAAGAARPRDAAAVARIEARRRAAATACLGSDAPPDRAAEPQRPAQPPVTVYPPPATGAPAPIALPAPPRAAPAPPPVPRVEPPVALTNCDVNGCWASDGTRLNRMGPMLVGPGGACSVIGTAVRCP